MSDNLKMMLRYFFTFIVTTGTARGWFNVPDATVFVNGAIDVITTAIAFGPMVYAAVFVKNTPKAVTT